MDFGLMFFSSAVSPGASSERHFHPFGGLFPNPPVVDAALAMITSQIEEGRALRRYREAREEHGLAPGAGRVAFMLHTFLGPDLDAVRGRVRRPFRGAFSAPAVAASFLEEL